MTVNPVWPASTGQGSRTGKEGAIAQFRNPDLRSSNPRRGILRPERATLCEGRTTCGAWCGACGGCAFANKGCEKGFSGEFRRLSEPHVAGNFTGQSSPYGKNFFLHAATRLKSTCILLDVGFLGWYGAVTGGFHGDFEHECGCGAITRTSRAA